MAKFEVGKKYKNGYNFIVECIHVSKSPNTTYVTMLYADGSVDTRDEYRWANYKEYKPPVEHVRYVHFIRFGGGQVVTSTLKDPEPPLNCKALKTIKVVYTENPDETS